MKTLNDLIEHYKSTARIDANTAWDIICNFKDAFEKHTNINEDELWKIMKCFHEKMMGKHFTEPYAIHQVSEMYHTNNKGTHIHEPLFTVEDAKKVYDKHIKSLGKGYTIWDVYVALNAQYHDNINLYNKWFPNATEDEIEEKIVQATIINWFEDEDGSDDKIWEYFKVI